ncbi:MAG: hypothetical protein Aurels2KO_31670 [Aureliella sp.]
MLQRIAERVGSLFANGYVPFCFLMAGVAVAPWLFASVQPWAQGLCLSLLLLGGVFFLAQTLLTRQTLRIPIPVWFIVALVTIGLFQCVQLPVDLVSLLSPNAIELRSDFGVQDLSFATISLAPADTRLFVAVLVGAALTLLLVAQLSNGWMLRPMLLVFAVNGAMLASFALLQKQFAENEIYGVVETVSTAIGPFVNRNNAAGYLLASFAAAFTLVIICRPERPKHREAIRVRWQAELADLTSSPTAIIALACLVAITAGLFLTASRGGLVGLASGLVAVVLFTAKRRNAAGLATGIGAVALVAIALLMAVESWSPSAERFETLGNQAALAKDGRLQIWEGSLWMGADFWRSGCGFGTFEAVFPVYDRHANGTRATHAENGFLQIFVEGGLISLLLVVLAITIALRHCLNLLTSRNRRERLTGTLGVFFLCSQTVANSFDFGCYIPANLLMYSCIAGIVYRTETLSKGDSRQQGNAGLLGLAFDHRGSLGLVGLVFFCLISINELMRASAVEVLPGGKQQASLLNNQPASDQAARLARNVVFRWDDCKAHAALAESNIRKFELALTKQVGAEVKLDALAQRIELAVASGVSVESVSGMAESDLSKRYLQPALSHLRAARKSCCLDPSVHLRLYQLGFLQRELDSVDTSIHLARSVRLREGYRYELYESGKDSLSNGDLASAFDAWKPCLESRSIYRKQIVSQALSVGDVESLLENLFPAEDWFLNELLNSHLTEERQRADRQLVAKRLSSR